MTVPPMAPGCPWSEVSNLWLPNIKWCEAQVCSIVVEPANTWSNLAYILIGLMLLTRATRRERRGAPHRMARTFGRAEIVVGVFSFAFHMSYSGFLQILDFAAMFVFVGLTLSLNLVRLGWLPEHRRTHTYVLGVVALTALVVGLRFTPFPIQLVTPVLILATAATELALWWRGRSHTPRGLYRWFLASLLLLVGAAVCSALDAARIWCDPHDHVVQGHALWHVLSAISLGLLARFYERLDELSLT